MTDWTIRDATAADARACAAIYAPYVTRTAISFESEPPTADEMADRIAAAQREHVWLVLTGAGGTNGETADADAGTGERGRGSGDGDRAPGDADRAGDTDRAAGERVWGYAYAGPFRARAAYRFSCEVSVYLEPGRRRTGAGRALYEALFARLARQGFTTAVAGMTLPNDPSVGLHRALGFEPVGTLRAVGWKDGAWWDVAMMQRPL